MRRKRYRRQRREVEIHEAEYKGLGKEDGLRGMEKRKWDMRKR